MARSTLRPTPLRLLALALSSLTAGACATGGGMSEQDRATAANIHAFTMATHMGEIEEGQLATTKTSNAAVRQFAQQMVDDHTTAMRREHEVMTDAGVGMHDGPDAMPAPPSGPLNMAALQPMLMNNPWSRPLMQNHMQAMTALRTMEGAAFDRAYMQRQVALHRYALGVLDQNMAAIDAVMPDAARDLMMTQRATIASHLERAQRIAGSM